MLDKARLRAASSTSIQNVSSSHRPTVLWQIKRARIGVRRQSLLV
jgi:hypothetical protein